MRIVRISAVGALLALSSGALVLFALTACGTMANMTDRPETSLNLRPGTPSKRIYGGVRGDVEHVWRSVQIGRDHESVGIILLVDLPICVVTDTLTLPLTIPATLFGLASVEQTSPPPKALPPQTELPQEPRIQTEVDGNLKLPLVPRIRSDVDGKAW